MTGRLIQKKKKHEKLYKVLLSETSDLTMMSEEEVCGMGSTGQKGYGRMDERRKERLNATK